MPNNSLSVFSSRVLFKSFILAVSIISLKFISSKMYSNSAAFSGELTTAYTISLYASSEISLPYIP